MLWTLSAVLVEFKKTFMLKCSTVTLWLNSQFKVSTTFSRCFEVIFLPWNHNDQHELDLKYRIWIKGTPLTSHEQNSPRITSGIPNIMHMRAIRVSVSTSMSVYRIFWNIIKLPFNTNYYFLMLNNIMEAFNRWISHSSQHENPHSSRSWLNFWPHWIKFDYVLSLVDKRDYTIISELLRFDDDDDDGLEKSEESERDDRR